MGLTQPCANRTKPTELTWKFVLDPTQTLEFDLDWLRCLVPIHLPPSTSWPAILTFRGHQVTVEGLQQKTQPPFFKNRKVLCTAKSWVHFKGLRFRWLLLLQMLWFCCWFVLRWPWAVHRRLKSKNKLCCCCGCHWHCFVAVVGVVWLLLPLWLFHCCNCCSCPLLFYFSLQVLFCLLFLFVCLLFVC